MEIPISVLKSASRWYSAAWSAAVTITMSTALPSTEGRMVGSKGPPLLVNGAKEEAAGAIPDGESAAIKVSSASVKVRTPSGLSRRMRRPPAPAAISRVVTSTRNRVTTRTSPVEGRQVKGAAATAARGVPRRRPECTLSTGSRG